MKALFSITLSNNLKFPNLGLRVQDPSPWSASHCVFFPVCSALNHTGTVIFKGT